MDLQTLEYDKVKCILEFHPVNVWRKESKAPPLDIVFITHVDYDYYTKKPTKGEEYFVPCYRCLGKYDEDVFMQESRSPRGPIEIQGNDDRKKIPMSLYGKFLQENVYYPSFYGYFNNVSEANRELIRKFRPWLEKTVVITERIKNFPELYKKFKTSKFKRPDDA